MSHTQDNCSPALCASFKCLKHKRHMPLVMLKLHNEHAGKSAAQRQVTCIALTLALALAGSSQKPTLGSSLMKASVKLLLNKAATLPNMECRSLVSRIGLSTCMHIPTGYWADSFQS